jgi:hypothetical protein
MVTTQLKGGMDPDHSALLREVKLRATLGWAEIDANYIMIQNAQDPGPDIAGSGSCSDGKRQPRSDGEPRSPAAPAPKPRADVSGQDSGPPGRNGAEGMGRRAQMSPARIVALQVVMERKAWG